MVQTGLHGTWSISVQGSLGCYSRGKSHLLRAKGRLRPISHGSFPIRVPKCTAKAKSERWGWVGCFSGSPRLPPTPTDGHDRLAICRGAGCASGSLEELRRKQPFRHREAANRAASRAALEGTEREIRE